MGSMGEAWPNPAVGELVAGVGPPEDCLAPGDTAPLQSSVQILAVAPLRLAC